MGWANPENFDISYCVLQLQEKDSLSRNFPNYEQKGNFWRESLFFKLVPSLSVRGESYNILSHKDE